MTVKRSKASVELITLLLLRGVGEAATLGGIAASREGQVWRLAACVNEGGNRVCQFAKLYICRDTAAPLGTTLINDSAAEAYLSYLAAAMNQCKCTTENIMTENCFINQIVS